MAESEEVAFDRWHSTCAHDNGDRKIEDKACVAAINHALRAILNLPDAEVTKSDISNWVLDNLGFGTSHLPLNRIEEHLAYEAGNDHFAEKKFKPKRPTICEKRLAVYSLSKGSSEYQFKEISHHRI
jgi:hypothetical protein